MKKISSIILLCSALLASSCVDLDEKLYNQVPMDEYGKTDSEIATIVGAAYASLRGFTDNSTKIACYPTCEFVFFLDECASDEACIPARGTDWYDNGVYIEAHTHNWTPTNKLFESYWKYCYNGIVNVNSVIYQIDKSGQSEENKNRIGAELRGLRAYYYWLLLNTFGDVPITTNFEESELPAKSDRKEVFKFVEDELLAVMNDLPSDISYGRFTQNVAYTLLARLYLNAEVYIGIPRWQDCLNACNKVSGYSLAGEYKANFAVDNEKSSEIIFAIPFDHKQGTTGNYLNSMSFNDQQWKAFSTVKYGGNWSANGISAQPGLYSSFDEKDVRRSCLLIGEQRDKATGAIITTTKGNQLNYTEDIKSIDMQNDGVGAECMGARLYKYAVSPDEEWERDYDWVLMRWAEVLMMKAEANLRLGFPDAGLPFVNEIRRRAGVSELSALTLETLDEEWRHEFVFEGLRRTVNIRFGTYFEPWWEKPATAYDSSKASRVFPIPANVLTLNPNLVQNPDYAQ